MSYTAFPKDFDIDGNYVKDTAEFTCRLEEEQTALLITRVHKAFGTEINDILITALALAVRERFRLDRWLIAVEGHGREEIIKEVNIKRTIGWFTCVYPVILDISHDNDLSRQIIHIKETLHQIPHKGIGYGILRYLTDDVHKKDINFSLRPQVCFNYLGQFDADVNKMNAFRIADESTGHNQCLQAQRDYLLDVLASIEKGQLVMTIIYNTRHFRRRSITGLLKGFKEKLLEVIFHCLQQKERELTPSDLTYKGLTMEDLDTLFD